MASRRGKGEGSVFRRRDGRWCGFVTIGYGPTGNQAKKWVYGSTRRQVAEKLSRLMPRAGTGRVDPLRISVSDWLQRWAAEKADSENLRHSTRANHQHYLRYLDSFFSRVPLSVLTALHIRTAYAHLAKRGLSPSVRRHVHHFLKAALKDALTAGLIERNPADAVDPPPLQRVREIRTWNHAEARLFLASIEHHRLYPCYALMLGLGLRIGEARGVRWEDLRNGRLEIHRTLHAATNIAGEVKTASSRRAIVLSKGQLSMLEEHRRTQELERSAAKRWVQTGYIFTTSVGTPFSYRNFLRSHYQLIARAGVPRVTPHALRHSYTDFAIEAGVPLKAVSARLGHKDEKLTLEVYHRINERQETRAALELDTLLTPTG